MALLLNSITTKHFFTQKHSPTPHSQTHKTYTFPTLKFINKQLQEIPKVKLKDPKNTPYPDQQNPKIVTGFYSSIETQKSNFIEEQESAQLKEKEQIFYHCGARSNMWWAEWRAALGQRLNIEGIVASFGIVAKDQHLAIPHVSVPDIRYIDWAELKKKGFQGVVFDKDNTLTIPYSLSLWAPLGPSLDQCKALFGENVAVFSNSAGLFEFDHHDEKARALEGALGIKVIRHRVKKPAGTAEEIESHFGCQSSRLIMVGDRPFTDIVYGNRNGFLTILTGPLSVSEEPFIVRQVRILEVALVNRWSREGLKKPISHELLPQPQQCVKDLPF